MITTYSKYNFFTTPILRDGRCRYYSHPQYYSEEPVVKGEFAAESQSQRKKKTNSKPKTANSAKYSSGQQVYVKKYNARSGKFQICEGEIVSSVDKGFGAILYTWMTLLTRKTYRAWEYDIYPSYYAARAALDCEESLKEVKKEDLKPTVKYDNLQNDKSINDDLSAVSVSTETESIMSKGSNIIEIDSCQAVDSIKVVKDDIMTANSTCNDIEQRVNYLEKELSKDKKKYSKLIRLGIACLFGG